MEKKTEKSKAGYAKLRYCANQARKEGLDYCWVDTCCINKQSSAELSEAINSMYRWYRDAKACYIYLSDVEKANWKKNISKARWFTRGWTLQELLAPAKAIFYDRRWQRLGTKHTLTGVIASVTQIPATALRSTNLRGYSIAQKMSWAAERVTTRAEDSVYCLLGLFDVNMPLLYREGLRAFFRLQEEIIKYNNDHSIFAWSMNDMKFSSLLASSPAYFCKCQFISLEDSLNGRGPFAMTNHGLSIDLKVTPWMADTYLAYLDCADRTTQLESVPIGIFLQRLSEDD